MSQVEGMRYTEYESKAESNQRVKGAKRECVYEKLQNNQLLIPRLPASNTLKEDLRECLHCRFESRLGVMIDLLNQPVM